MNSASNPGNVDAIEKFANSAVKALLAALAFSALALGLTERYRELDRFIPMGNYILGRELLNTALQQLEQHPCWLAYKRVLRDSPATIQDTSVAAISNISCAPAKPENVTIGSLTLPVPRPKDNQPTAANSAAAPVVPAKPAAPAEPLNLSISLLYPVSIETLSGALGILTADDELARAKKYSNRTRYEITVWQNTLHSVLFARQAVLGRLPNRETDALTIADLTLLNALPRETLATFDELSRHDFRAELPNSSFGVTMGSATLVVAFTLVVFVVALAAYCKAISRHEGFYCQTTILPTMMRSSALNLFLLALVITPVSSLIFLVWNLYLSKPEKDASLLLLLLIACMLCLSATGFILITVVPRMRLRERGAMALGGIIRSIQLHRSRPASAAVTPPAETDVRQRSVVSTR